jgi:uncharacterized protein YecE (DUF72 family)
MQLFIGTSGYSYKEWRGSFYPPKLPAKDMLGFYAQHFNVVEMNNTHYKMPTVEGVEAWAVQTPPGFRFVLKAPQTITHFKRLRNVEAEVGAFVAAADALGRRRGPLLFQLPPNFKQDLPRLEAFLDLLRDGPRVVMEFRHESWFADDVYDCLRTYKCALCVNDAEDAPAADLVSTTDFGYLRLRRTTYTAADLGEWLGRTRAQKWDDAYILFRHEDTGAGPAFAKQLLELAATA